MIDTDFDLIIFDCDGTLVDSEPITNRVLAEFISEFGLQMTAEKALELFIGRDMAGIITVLESKLGQSLPDDFASEFRKRQAMALKADLKAINGAAELLDSVSKRMCVASNAPQAKIAINLEVTGLAKHFPSEVVFSAYDIEVWKPEPDLFLYVAEKMKTSPTRCVVIEDSEAGIEAGLAAGMQVIGFTNQGERAIKNVPSVGMLSELIAVLGTN